MTAARCTNLISRYHGDSHWRRASMIIAVMGRSALRAAIDLATAAIEHFGAELGFLLLARVRAPFADHAMCGGTLLGHDVIVPVGAGRELDLQDRKSTRPNSSH